MSACEYYRVEENKDGEWHFMNGFKFKKAAELYVEYLELIPVNRKLERKFRIHRTIEDASTFPAWSWYWTQTEKEAVKIQQENLDELKKSLGL